VERSSQTRRVSTAIKQLATPLASDEPRTVDWFLANIEELGGRFARLNPDKKSDTAATYTSRARNSAEDFLRWRDNPTTFKFRTREAAPRESRKSVEESAAAPRKAEAPTATTGTMRTFPTADGTDFVFALPPGGISANDVKRIAYHLLTLARDFDPGAPAELFAISRTT
jgi:hypothetical protein